MIIVDRWRYLMTTTLTHFLMFSAMRGRHPAVNRWVQEIFSNKFKAFLVASHSSSQKLFLQILFQIRYLQCRYNNIMIGLKNNCLK